MKQKKQTFSINVQALEIWSWDVRVSARVDFIEFYKAIKTQSGLPNKGFEIAYNTSIYHEAGKVGGGWTDNLALW